MAAEASTPEQLVQVLASELGERLHAVYRFGSGFAQGPRAGQARLLVLVDRVDRPLLDRMAPAAQRAREAEIQLRVDATDNLLRGADALPAFSLEILDTRELLAGSDVLEDLQVQHEHLRLHVEHGLRSVHRDLVAAYLDPPATPKLRRSAHKLVLLLEAALKARGVPVPHPATPDAIIDGVRESLLGGANSSSWDVLRRFANNEIGVRKVGLPRLYDALLDTLDAVIDAVDRMESGD